MVTYHAAAVNWTSARDLFSRISFILRYILDKWQQPNKRSRNPTSAHWGIILRFTFQVYFSYLDHICSQWWTTSYPVSFFFFFSASIHVSSVPFFTTNRLLLYNEQERLVFLCVTLNLSASLFDDWKKWHFKGQ